VVKLPLVLRGNKNGLYMRQREKFALGKIFMCNISIPRDPKSYGGGSLLLVGSPLPDRSKVMAQTLYLQVGGWAAC
jgi:hypothetical protein